MPTTPDLATRRLVDASWGTADRLHAHRVLVFVFHETDVAHRRHIDASRPAVALECPGSLGGLKFAQRARPFSCFISDLPLPHSHSPPSTTHIFFFLMSSNEDQFVTDLVHELLNDIVTLNLSTGLAYGTPPPRSHPYRFLLVFFFHSRRLTIHPLGD